MFRRLTTLAKGACLGLVSASALFAQQAADSQLPGHTPVRGAMQSAPQPLGKTVAAPKVIFDGRIPIHTQAADPITNAPYGTWAAGAGFKASFHDGFTFVPYLGASYPKNLPLAWRTVSMRRGQDVLVQGGKATHHHTDWRYEYRWTADITEAYDVRRDGVEQTFTFARPLAGQGDLVVRGRITTELTADVVEGEQTALEFRDAKGTKILRYGEGTVLDSKGRKAPVLTSFDGTHLELRVADAWLRTASYPVTIDPITVPLIVFSHPSGRQGWDETSVIREDFGNDIYIGMAQRVSATDEDVYVLMTSDLCSTASVRYADITTSWLSKDIQLASQNAARRVVGVWARVFAAPAGSQLRAVRVPFNSGAASVVTGLGSSNIQRSRPDVGGTAFPSTGGTNVMVVYQEDATATPQGNTATSRVFARPLNASTGLFGLPRQLSTTLRDAEYPNINAYSDGANADDCFIVAWQQHTNTAIDDWDINLAMVRATDALVMQRRVVVASGNDKMRPVVEGAEVNGTRGHYLVGWTEHPRGVSKATNYAGRYQMALEFDWDCGGLYRRRCLRTLEDTGGARSFWNGRDYGYDVISGSHWKVVFQNNSNARIHVHRVGYECRSVERAVLTGPNNARYYQPSATYNDDRFEYPIVFHRLGGGSVARLMCARCTYGASWSFVGTTCAGAGVMTVQNGDSYPTIDVRPHKGSRFYKVGLIGGTRNGFAFLYISPWNIPVTLPGTTCTIDAFYPQFIFGFRLPSSGNISVPLPLPDGLPNLTSYVDFVHVTATFANPKSPRGIRVNLR